MVEGLKFASKMADAMAAWVECEQEKRGFVVIAYETTDGNNVDSVVAGMGNIDICSHVAINAGVEVGDMPMSAFVEGIRDRLAKKYLEKMLKNGMK